MQVRPALLALTLVTPVLVACEEPEPETVEYPATSLGQLAAAGAQAKQTRAVAPDGSDAPLAAIIDELAEHGVVHVGETHVRFDHHLNQLAILQGLHARHPDLAIGVEYFQHPDQAHLDAYVAGRIDAVALLKRTDYYRRWGFDFRVYAPIFAFARAHGIPIVALNLRTALVRKVRRKGLEALTPEERAALPADIERANPEYRALLEEVFARHGEELEGAAFEHFYQAQLVWDETMADRAAAHLRAHPQRRLLVLAGNGHLAYGYGIPQRLRRRIEASQAVVLNDWQGEVTPALADYLLRSDPTQLAEPGRLGVLLEDAGRGARVSGFAETSGAQAAGLREGDELIAVTGEAVTSAADVKAVLWDRAPGETVRVTVLRDGRRRRYEVRLG